MKPSDPLEIVSIVGARPQFIKAAPLGQALADRGHHHYLVHTGQHYDYSMSQVFFEEMGLPQPFANLGIGSGAHVWQTAQMLAGLEQLLLQQQAAGQPVILPLHPRTRKAIEALGGGWLASPSRQDTGTVWPSPADTTRQPFGDGHASQRIVQILEQVRQPS